MGAHYASAFHLPYQVAQKPKSALDRVGACLPVGGPGVYPRCPGEAGGGWARTPHGGAWGNTPIQQPLSTVFIFRYSFAIWAFAFPVKSFKNVTLEEIVASFKMLPCYDRFRCFVFEVLTFALSLFDSLFQWKRPPGFSADGPSCRCGPASVRWFWRAEKGPETPNAF